LKILVTVGEGVGNMVETTPLISKLASRCRVDVLAKPTVRGTEQILDDRRFVNELFTIDDPPPDVYDFVFQTFSANTHKDPEFGAFDRVIEFTADDTRYAHAYGEAKANNRLIQRVGEDFPGDMVSWVARSGRVPQDASFEHIDVVLHPGAYNASKRWPFFRELDEYIRSRGLSTFLFRENPPDIRDAAEVISRGSVFVGNDSGQSHVAAALGVETVMIFGPTPIEKNVPFNYKVVHVVRVPTHCRPCFYQKATFENCSFACQHKITTEEVLKITLEALGDRRKT